MGKILKQIQQIENLVNEFSDFARMPKPLIKNYDLIIDDASHILSDMIKSLKFFFQQLDSNGIFVIEDFNAPVYFEALNDTKGKELLMNNLLKNIMKKKKFKSNWDK